MASTGETPRSVFTDEPRNSAKSLLSCQEPVARDYLNTNPVAILVERRTETTEPLVVALQRASGCSVELIESAHEVLAVTSTYKSAAKIVLHTIGRDVGPAFRLIRNLREQAMEIRCECPRFFVLSLVIHQPEVSYRFEKLGVEYLLRQYPVPIVEAVRRAQWRLRETQFSRPVIVLHRRGGHIAKVLAWNGPAHSALKIGPRLRRLLEFFATHMHTELSTAMIADAMGLCLRSPKQYLSELRAAWDHAFGDPSLLPGEDVFITTRMPGGHVHRANAHFEIVDEPEF